MDLPPSTVAINGVEDHEKTLKQLRREWKWAAASDFLCKFNPILRLDFLDLADVERDIIRGTSDTIMSVILKILHVLTSIRGLGHDTWELYMRRLYARRVPESRVWGTEEVPLDWKDLGWETRLEVLYTLVDWLFQAPLKVRQAMKDDSDDASWRSAPIGRDAKRNEYWRLGRNRLWIKRSTEKPTPEPRGSKRKRGNTKVAQRPSKRKALENGVAKSASASSKSNRRKKKKQQEKAPRNSKPPTKTPQASSRRLGTRLTRTTDDGWQKVPDEWMKSPSSDSGSPARTAEKSDVEALFDDASDLTDLSDEERKDDAVEDDTSESDLTDIEEDEEQEEETKQKSDSDVSMASGSKEEAEFVELETICITINEWKDFAEQFKSVRSHNERRLYRYINQVVIPELEQWEEAREEKQKKDLKDMLRREQAAAAALAAESRPKRSTRIATLVEEEKTKYSAEGDSPEGWSRSSRTRRAAARTARWFADHQESLDDTPESGEDKPIDGQEQVKNEGDERVSGAPRRRKKDTDQEDYEDMPSEADEPPRRQPTPVNGMGRPRRAAAIKADLNRPRQATRRRRLRSDSEEENESDEPFFLNCEVCKRSGWNQDDSQHLISCQDCGIWQHMTCHDRADKAEGRPRRNWGKERFLCSACTQKAQSKRPRRARKPRDATEDGTGNEASQDAQNMNSQADSRATASQMDLNATSESLAQVSLAEKPVYSSNPCLSSEGLNGMPQSRALPPISDDPLQYSSSVMKQAHPQPQQLQQFARPHLSAPATPVQHTTQHPIPQTQPTYCHSLSPRPLPTHQHQQLPQHQEGHFSPSNNGSLQNHLPTNPPLLPESEATFEYGRSNPAYPNNGSYALTLMPHQPNPQYPVTYPSQQ